MSSFILSTKIGRKGGREGRKERKKKRSRNCDRNTRGNIIIYHKTVDRLINPPPSPPIIPTIHGSSISSEVGDPIPFDDGFNAHRR